MKRKVILYISQSLDGFIADNKGSVDWILGNEELSPNEWVYKGLQSYVFTEKTINDVNDIKFVNEDIISFIKKLRKEKGKDIWICGGSNILNQLVKENLIDEYQITTVPVILGDGIRLFEEKNKKIKLELKETKIENGLIMGRYI